MADKQIERYMAKRIHYIVFGVAWAFSSAFFVFHAKLPEYVNDYLKTPAIKQELQNAMCHEVEKKINQTFSSLGFFEEIFLKMSGRDKFALWSKYTETARSILKDMIEHNCLYVKLAHAPASPFDRFNRECYKFVVIFKMLGREYEVQWFTIDKDNHVKAAWDGKDLYIFTNHFNGQLKYEANGGTY